MRFNLMTRCLAMALLAMSVGTPDTLGGTIAVNGPWVVTNGTANVVGATTNSPTFNPVSPATLLPGLTVQSAFPASIGTISLANDGDYLEAEATYQLVRNPTNQSFLTNQNRLNVQMRIGLFDAPAAPTTGSSGSPRGFIAEYGAGGSADVRGLVATQANPFSGGAGTPSLGSGSAGSDPEGNFLSGTPVEAHFVFRITRNGSNVNLTGKITGETVDPLDNDYLQQFSIIGHTPHASFDFDLNRIAFLIGGNIEATTATLANVRIRSNLIVPEPASWLLCLSASLAAVVVRRRRGCNLTASTA